MPKKTSMAISASVLEKRLDDIAPLSSLNVKLNQWKIAQVDFRVLLGAKTVLVTKMTGQEPLRKAHNPREVGAGDVPEFDVAMDNSHLFYAETGKSVRPHHG